MEQTLMQIVKPDQPPGKRIDRELLEKSTRRINDFLFVIIRWQDVKHLYLVGESDCLKSGVRSGTYMDVSRQWVLIAGAHAVDIQRYLSHCSNSLERLFILCTDVTKLDIHNLTQLKELVLEDNTALSEIHGYEQLKYLEELIITNSALKQIAFPKSLENLRFLNLRGNNILHEIQGLDNLSGLECLYLAGTSVKKLNLPVPLGKLFEFDAMYTKLEDISFVGMIPNVKRLYLMGTSISCIPSLEVMDNLEILFLDGCPITTMDGITFPDSLKKLSLSSTSIHRIPEAIGQLPNLEYLDLSGMQLDALPDWLPDYNRTVGRKFGYSVNLAKTTVDGVDMSIFDRSQEMILRWFEERKSGGMRPLNELKVVFLGDGGAGKSRTIARLLLDGEQTEVFPNISTPGIVIRDKSYLIGDRDVKVHFWDFGGQDILHSMHRMFLTERTLYVVMLNVRDGTQTERGRYWLHNIRSFTGGAPVLLVLNQIDTNRNAQVNLPDLRALYPALTEVVAMSALEDDAASFRDNLIAALKRQIGAFPTLESPFLPAWDRLKERLQTMEASYIKGDEFESYCTECGVEDNEKTRLVLLHWFNDLGISFHYGTSTKLKDFVILRPDWITNAIYTIIFNKSDELQNGLISHEAIYTLLHSNSPEVRRAIPEMVYQKHEVDYVLDVIRKFRLSFRVGDDTEFIPLLCRADSLPIAAAYEKNPHTLEFRMKYEYLPTNVLHRLMVDLRRDLDTNQVWLTGALFRQESNGLSAVVKTEGDVLRIFVKGENDLHRPHTYLNTIRDALAVIQRDMGLAEPKTLVTYKREGKTESFSYKRLLGTLRSGAKEVYSDTWDRMISVEDILNQTDREVERKKQKVLADMAGACVRMQSKKILWSASEDDRNTELRDLLWSMGYRVADQSLTGVGAGGKRAGELDLLILNKQNLPWMACEAMNIKNDSPSQIEYWDKHLNKLLVNYNSAGMQDLLLVSYVSATAEEFRKYWQTYSEHMRWYDPPEVIRRDGTYEVFSPTPEQYNCLWAVRCTYDRGGMPTTVHHYFLRMGQ